MIQPNKYVRCCMTPMYATLGCIVLYIIALKCTQKHTLSSNAMNVSVLCFGVYLFQQFLLVGLYRHTNLSSIVGFYWLPWVGFGVSMIGSLLLTYLMRLSKIGRYLIG